MLCSTALLIPVEKTAEKAPGLCWRTKTCVQQEGPLVVQAGCVFPAGCPGSQLTAEAGRAARSGSLPPGSHLFAAQKHLVLDLAWKKIKLCFCCFPMFI